MKGPAPASTAPPSLLQLWLATIAIAGLGTAIGFLAEPGVNWGIWTIAASGAFLYFVRRSGRALDTPLLTPIVLACVLAVGTAITADGAFWVMILCSVVTLLAIATMVAVGQPIEDVVGLGVLPIIPPSAAVHAVVESGGRASELVTAMRAERSVPVLRGAVIAVPVVVICALLLSGADPLFAAWRDYTTALISRCSFIPRVFFFLGLGTLTLGAYGIALRNAQRVPPIDLRTSPNTRLGDTERLMVVASVAAVLALFLALQLSYALGNVPATPGSGVTYAEYAHRGFAELTIVASLCSVLIMVLDRYAERGARHARVRLVSLFLIAELELLLVFAYHRLMLYENAYGYTTTRLYAEIYMLVAAVLLVMLAREVLHTVDARRLVRRAALLGALALAGLIYWNHEAWIANRNIERFRNTGKLDLDYLGRELSLNAAPTTARLLSMLPPGCARVLRKDLAMYAGRQGRSSDRAWYEWNLRRSRGMDALRAANVFDGQLEKAPASDNAPNCPIAVE